MVHYSQLIQLIDDRVHSTPSILMMILFIVSTLLEAAAVLATPSSGGKTVGLGLFDLFAFFTDFCILVLGFSFALGVANFY